ncbi:hypothetical protein FJY90_07435 [Candidatus Gottesmanbacteria bacterium]|nr:hypothetical protein [Candidatus Gottesmanbacteria bacterium]
MTKEIKRMAPIALGVAKKAKRILLHLHPSPDPDSVGASLAIAHVFKKMGKEVTLIGGDSDIPKSLAYLPHFEWIQPKNYTQIVPEDFDLFFILDSSAPDQISKLKEVNFPETMMTVVVDHHFTNLKYGKVNIVDPTYPATCQILYDIFRLWKVEISADVAVCLYVGIYADTGGFKYLLTAPDTLLVASELAKINPNFPKVIFEIENNLEPQQILFQALALSSLKKYFSDNVVIATVPYAELSKRGILKRHTEKMEIANTIKSVAGWNIGISFVETEPNKINVSLRTRNPERFDVSKIASSVGGGGHKAAAGATICAPFSEALDLLLGAITRNYPELKT